MIGIIFFIIGIICLSIGFYLIKKSADNHEEEKKEYEEILSNYHKELNKLESNKNLILGELTAQREALNRIKQDTEIQRQEKEKLNDSYKKQLEEFQIFIQDLENKKEENKQISKQAYSDYFSVLDNYYNQVENEFDNKIKNIEQDTDKRIQLIKDQEKEAQADLAKIFATRAAAQEALLREKEIKEQKSFYCLSINDNDLADIKVLERIKPQLTKPRILSMLIWSTYWQKPMTNLCNNVIGASVKTGIYKITNQETNECYIGQGVDLARRWKEHAKCGLGIDTPAGNKLYNAIQNYGIWNFSWEVLEECPREELNRKEKYYIQLYQADKYGYNSTAGNKG